MRVFSISFFFLAISAWSQGIPEPVLNKQEIIQIANEYLLKKQGVQLEEYEMSNIEFSKATKYDYGNKWHLLYKSKATEHGTRRTGWFTLTLSNSKKPKIELSWGY